MRITTTLALGSIALLLAGALVIAAGPTMDQISSAKTAADHEAIAAEYSKQAAEAKAKATEHDEMGKMYSGYLKEKVHFEEHCRALAASYRNMAKELEAMASMHRDLAKQAAK